MTDVRPELIDRAARAGFAAAAASAAERYGLDRPVTWENHLTDGDREHELTRTRAILLATADALRAEGAAKALREAAEVLDAYDATNSPPADDRWTCDLGYYGEAAWLRNRADQIARTDQ